jgi:hypothetical protein
LKLKFRFKNLCLISSLIGCEKDVTSIEEYDKSSLYLMFLKYHHHLHPLVESKSDFVNQRFDENHRNLEITIINTSEPTKALINTKFYIFKWYQTNMKDIKCHFH